MNGPTDVYISPDCNLQYTADYRWGWAPFSYQWSVSGGTIKQDGGSTIIAAFPTAGFKSVSVTITDAVGAQQSATIGVYASEAGQVCAY